MEALFWGGVLALAIPYALYPMLVYILATIRPRPTKRSGITPTVTVIITAHNEESAIVEKLRNTSALDYPADLLDIMVADDGSSDATVERAEALGLPNLRVVPAPRREGKTAAQNFAMDAATGELILFTDATAMLQADALRLMVSHFADPDVGCVTGNIAFNLASGGMVQKGLGARRGFEVNLRIRQSLIWTNFGATGAVYMIRREGYVPLPADVVSDFVEPMQQLMRGLRTIYEPDAWCYMARPVQSGGEFRRRRRITVRGLRGVWYCRTLLDPLRHPWSAFSLICHRIIRWMGPIFMILVLIASASLSGGGGFYRMALVLQLAFYLAAALGWISTRTGTRLPLVHLPYFFTLVNLAALSGWWALLRGEQFVVWDKAVVEKTTSGE